MRQRQKIPDACTYTDDGSILCDTGEGYPVEMKKCVWRLGGHTVCTGMDGEEHPFPDRLFRAFREKDTLLEKALPEMEAIGEEGEKVEKSTYRVYNVGEGAVVPEEKDLYHAGFAGDLGEPGVEGEIVNPRSGEVVRQIHCREDEIEIESAQEGSPTITLPRNAEIYYEPWMMDVGSFLFPAPADSPFPQGKLLKLGTERDIQRPLREQ